MNGHKNDTSAVELEPYVYDQEDAPFLGSDDIERDGAHRPVGADSSPTTARVSNASRWQLKTPFSIVLVAAIAKFFIVTTGLMIMMPMYRLIEDTLCHAHFKDDSPDIIDEMKCKTDEVQSDLAYMLGWFGLVNAIFRFAVAYPYGILSDTIGRKPVLLLAYTGQALAFCLVPFFFGTLRMTLREHPYILMIDVLFTLLGGGVPVLLSTFYAIASDVSGEKDKTPSFLYLAMGASAGGLLGPLISGILMSKYGPWVPVYITLFSIPLVYAVIFLVPETLVKKPKSNAAPVSLKEQIRSGIRDLSSATEILRNVNVPLVLVVFFFTNPRMTAESTTLAQYVSKNFGWTLAQTSVLLSPLGLVGMLVLGLLPKISDLLTSKGRYGFGFSNFRKDMFLLRTSMLLLTLASLIQGVSLNIVPFIFGLFIATLGGADSPLARATVSHFVDDAYTSRLYALIGMAEVLGSFTGGPVVAWFFEKGMKLKGIFTGLPWFYISFLCFLTWVALMFVKPPVAKRSVEEDILSDEEEVEEPEPHPNNAIRLD